MKLPTLRAATSASVGPRLTLRTWTLSATQRQFHPAPAHAKDDQLNSVNPRNSPHGQRGTSPPLDNAPGWNEDLATTSESSVKADKEKTTISEMQKKTADYAQSQQNAKDIESTRASYAREEVDGPLGSAGVGEFEGVVGNDDLGLDEMDVDPNGRVVTRRVVHEKKTTPRESGSGAGQANA